VEVPRFERGYLKPYARYLQGTAYVPLALYFQF